MLMLTILVRLRSDVTSTHAHDSQADQRRILLTNYPLAAGCRETQGDLPCPCRHRTRPLHRRARGCVPHRRLAQPCSIVRPRRGGGPVLDLPLDLLARTRHGSLSRSRVLQAHQVPLLCVHRLPLHLTFSLPRILIYLLLNCVRRNTDENVVPDQDATGTAEADEAQAEAEAREAEEHAAAEREASGMEEEGDEDAGQLHESIFNVTSIESRC